MSTRGRFLWLLSLLLIDSCSSPPGTVSDGGAPVLLSYVVDAAASLQEGELCPLRLKVENRQSDPVLLLDLTPTDDTPPVLFQRPRRGRLEYDRARDLYRYDARAEDYTERVFNAEILLPRESREFSLKIRLLSFPKGFVLHYVSLPAETAQRDLYFPRKEEKETVYGRLTGEDLELALEGRRTSSSSPLLLFPHGMGADQEQEVLAIELSYAPQAFTWEAAVRKTGLTSPPSRFSYLSTFQLWFVQEGERAWLVGPSSLRRVAPSLHPEMLCHLLDTLDSDRVEVEFRGETKTLFSGSMRLARTFRRGEHRWVAFVDRAEWIPFLEKTGELGLRTDVEMEGAVGRLLVVR